MVTGASGYLGWHLTRCAVASDHEVLGCYFANPTVVPGATMALLDFTDPQAGIEAVKDFKPHAIVHAGAMTNTTDCEINPESATRTNVEGTQHLLAAASMLSPLPHFVFISTDLVFDGERGMYREQDATGPLMHYGFTKIEAERAVRNYAGVWTVVRSSLIYGPAGETTRHSFLDWMLAGIRRGGVTLYTDEFRSPVHVDDLCEMLMAILIRKAWGIYHLSGAERTSRYEFGLLAAEAFGLSQDHIVGKPSPSGIISATPRPKDVSLCVERAIRDLDYHPMSAEEGLRRVARGSK
jgi:dTDP-4-dehydrorhamnose reductase